VASGDRLQNAFLVRLVLFPIWKYFLYQLIEIRVGPEGPFGHQLLAARRALLVAGPQGSHDAFGAKSGRKRGGWLFWGVNYKTNLAIKCNKTRRREPPRPCLGKQCVYVKKL
jgi:hypothetical protein